MSHKFGTVDICGHKFPVIEKTSDEDQSLETCSGYIRFKPQEIVIEAAMEPEAFRDVLLHEVLHGILHLSGATDVIATAMGTDRSNPAVDTLEESFIRIVTPHLVAALASMKGLKVK